MSIITGRGDKGQTDLLFGRRIAKSSARIGVLGTIDELNAALGLARAASGDAEVISIVDRVQERLIGLMGELACDPDDVVRYREQFAAGFLPAGETGWIECVAREMESGGIRFTGWAKPGAEGAVAKAALDFARSIARRAEREIWAFHESGSPVREEVRLYFNRLSDLLWIMARAAKELGGE